MIIYIDTQTLDLTTEGYVPLTDMALVRGDKIPLRIILKNGLGIDTESQEAPVLAVKKSLGNDTLVLAATGLQRVEDALGAAYVGSLVVNTAQLAEAMGDQPRIDLVGEVVLVAPDGAQRTSRLIRVTVRADLLPDEYEPPATVLADWNNLVDASLAARLPDALHDAGVYLTPVPGAATLIVEGGTLPYALGCYLLPLSAPAVIGHLAGHYSINRLTITAPASHNNGTAWMMRLWRYQSGTMSELGTSTDQATWADTAEAARQTCSWEFSGVEVAAADVLVIQVYDRDGSSKQMQGCARQMDQGAGMGICSVASGSPQITHPCAMGITLDTTYQDGVSVGGTELASKKHFDALAAEVRDTLPQVNQAADDAGTARDDARAIAEGLTISTGTITTGQPGSQAAASLRPGDAPGSWVLDMTIPQGRTGAVDTAQAYVWTQPQTYAAMINANGGVNIPMAVGAATDTSAVNRMYAAGLAGVTDIYTQHYYLVTDNIAATGPATTKVHAPGHFVQTCIGAYGHGTVTHSFIGPSGQHNYSAFAGFSIPWRYTSICKFTVHIGRGSTTIRTDLTLDSYSVIPGNDLAYNLGEILDITFTNVRDTVRNGYVVRVREIYALNSAEGWKVKTTTSFVPATHNEPVPSIVNKIIYQQCVPAPYEKYTYKAFGALYLLTGNGARAQRLFKIATVRGLDTFDVSVGFSTIVSDLFNVENWDNCLYVGSAERNLYQSGNINPVYYALEAVAANTIESEVTEDFVDINNLIQ